MMYRINWSDLVTPALLDALAAAGGLPASDPIRGAQAMIAEILRASGGLPVAAGIPDDAQLAAWTLSLLHESIRHTLARMQPVFSSPGFRTLPSTVPEIAALVNAAERVAVNWAGVAEIAGATGTDEALALAIVDERRAGGEFHSLKDLDGRVKGVGPRHRDLIAATARFDAAEQVIAGRLERPADLARDLQLLTGRIDLADRAARILLALEIVAAVCSGDPHPATCLQQPRAMASPSAPQPGTVDWVGVLFSQDYFTGIQQMLGEAKTSIDVCMFHISFPGENHPTRQLIKALKAAHTRGIAVRVLVDRDRPEDPYRSTVDQCPGQDRARGGRDCRPVRLGGAPAALEVPCHRPPAVRHRQPQLVGRLLLRLRRFNVGDRLGHDGNGTEHPVQRALGTVNLRNAGLRDSPSLSWRRNPSARKTLSFVCRFRR